MGTNVSTDIERNIVENVTTQTTALLQQFVQQNQQNTVVTQAVNIVINGKLSCASLTITNDAKVSMRSLSQIDAKQSADLQEFVTQALEAQADTELAQQNEELSLLQTNVSTVVKEAITATKSEQKLACTQTFEQTITQTTISTQTVNLTVGEAGEVFITGDCVFTNTASVTYTAEQVVTATMDVVLSKEAVQQQITDWDTAIKQLNKGVNIGAIVGGIIGAIVLIIIVAVAIKYGMEAARRKKAAALTGGGSAPKK